MAYLECNGIAARLGDVQAVDGLSLSVGQGEFLAILGPSGCGKTTTLNLVAGFLRPTAGRIVLDGRDLTGVAVHRRGTAMVFQNYALFPHMTVFDNVLFGLKMHHVPRDMAGKQVAEALELVRLPKLGDRYPRQLSGGQQQRVALARALVLQPKLLLLDEPLSNLDEKLRADMRIELREIQQQVGITTLFVTHDIHEAFELADRVAVMNQGRIEQVGPPRDIYEQPATEFVSRFVGYSNVLEGRVVATTGRSGRVRTSGGIEFAIAPIDDRAVGEVIRVRIRPERLILGPTSGARENSFRGRIERVSYLGSLIQYWVTAASDRVLVSVQNSEQAIFSPGSEVVVGWRSEDCTYE